MLTKSPYSFNPVRASAPLSSRDAELVQFVRSVVDAARRQWENRVVAEPNVSFDSLLLYTETHYALAAVLLYLLDGHERSWLDLAATRLQLWNRARLPVTFFSAMAVCLTALIFRRSGAQHQGLESVLGELLARAPEHRSVAYKQWCGNNAYLQQVAVDTVLLPLARGQRVREEGVNCLIGEFRRYRTSEGFFYDLPRQGTMREPLLPPTYIMKMLFLAGVCHELHPGDAFAGLFRTGIASALPLITREGGFSYVGRTDNSPFAAGLTIFNLRKAARLPPGSASEYDEACLRAERYYQTFPRTPSGMLECNRFADARTPAERVYSRDDYAYVGQYSLSSCAYALLGCYWFPTGSTPVAPRTAVHPPSVATSKDLGLVKLSGHNHELILRTGSEITAWDRRYLGPTVLRYELNGQLLVGAISRTISTDRAAQVSRPPTPARRMAELFQHRFSKGMEHLDGTSVGFLPVVRHGAFDYLPHGVVSMEVSPSSVKATYRMVRLKARGWHPCFLEALELVHGNVRGLKPREYSQPGMMPVGSIVLSREIHLQPHGLRIDDCVSGDLRGKTILFSVRFFPCASVRVRGLTRRQSTIGWGSEGRQTLELYEAQAVGSECGYGCDIEPA